MKKEAGLRKPAFLQRKMLHGGNVPDPDSRLGITSLASRICIINEKIRFFNR